MRQRIPRFLFVAISVLSMLLLAGGSARAVTFSYTMTLDSIESSNWATTATYTYTLTQGIGSSTLSYVDFEIPVEINIPVGPFAGATSQFSVTANGVTLSGEVYDIGVGDYGTKAGVGDTRYRVLKANVPNPPQSFKLVLVLKNQSFGGRLFANASQSEYGVVIIKAGNGSNTQSFIRPTPTVVNPPANPPPVFLSLAVFPNPVVLLPGSDCATVSYALSNATGVSLALESGSSSIQDVTLTGATVCPLAAGPHTYRITATGAGGSTTQTFSLNAVNAPPPPLDISFSYLPNPVTAGEVLTVTWNRQDATVTINTAYGFATTEVLSDHATIRFSPTTTPGTYIFDITATGPGGSSASVSFLVTVNPPPVIETSCKQIVKHSGGRKTCTYVCLKTINGLQDMDTATWYDNGDCDPLQSPGYPLTIYGPKSPQKSLMCAPCRTDVTFPHPEVCPENTQIGTTPFRIDLTGVDPVSGAAVSYSVYCDYLHSVSQDQGFAAALGDDGVIYVNGKQVRTYP